MSGRRQAGPDEAAADAEAFGMPADIVAGLAEPEDKPQTQGIGVWPENWDIVIAFMAVSTQWNAVALSVAMPMGGSSSQLHYIGLNHAGVEAKLRGCGLLPRARTPVGVRRLAELWDGLAEMEAAACAKMNGVEILPEEWADDA